MTAGGEVRIRRDEEGGDALMGILSVIRSLFAGRSKSRELVLQPESRWVVTVANRNEMTTQAERAKPSGLGLRPG